ncbi:MAG: hypothetical protein OXT68_00400 [Chloroflexota bacterium]|nr:hypothetical protein [Chloroflexota bacterium]
MALLTEGGACYMLWEKSDSLGTDFILLGGDVAYDKNKIANSFYLPKHSSLRGLASLFDFTRSEGQEFTERILARSDAEAMRADWEAVGADLWLALGQYEECANGGKKA